MHKKEKKRWTMSLEFFGAHLELELPWLDTFLKIKKNGTERVKRNIFLIAFYRYIRCRILIISMFIILWRKHLNDSTNGFYFLVQYIFNPSSILFIYYFFFCRYSCLYWHTIYFKLYLFSTSRHANSRKLPGFYY